MALQRNSCHPVVELVPLLLVICLTMTSVASTSEVNNPLTVLAMSVALPMV